MNGDVDGIESLLTASVPVRMLDETGKLLSRIDRTGDDRSTDARLSEAYRWMVIGRRFDDQAIALAKQGRLAAYPSSRGQEAAQVSGVLALGQNDWVFPTYRDSTALLAWGLDPVQILTAMRGDWHCGYDPHAVRAAPQCTPLATHALHATGFAYAARRRGEDRVALVFVGDGATSEGDFHEALNFAGVFAAPVVFLVQNNQYAISVPRSKQSAARSLAHKGIGHGVASVSVDGNDALAVLTVMQRAIAHARAGRGPYLIEALTYRVSPHTSTDDDSRYREQIEVEQWIGRDPIVRLEHYLCERGILDDWRIAEIRAEADAVATRLRSHLSQTIRVDPRELFRHVYAMPTPQLQEQLAWLEEELDAEREQESG